MSTKVVTPLKEMSACSRSNIRGLSITSAHQKTSTNPGVQQVDSQRSVSNVAFPLSDYDSATEKINGWGLCLEDCPYQEPIVSCLQPPPVPKFGMRDESGAPFLENYVADWFTIAFVDNSDTSTLTKFHEI